MVDMNTAINQVRNMDSAQLNEMIAEIKLRRNYISSTTARSLVKGAKVQFTGRGGEVVTGTVTKVNQKTVVVDAGVIKWKVTASMLTQI
tara:strand:- start:1005 stop:1271 length:267 start_codon:yes stop_codon:yes gene_type:complete